MWWKFFRYINNNEHGCMKYCVCSWLCFTPMNVYVNNWILGWMRYATEQVSLAVKFRACILSMLGSSFEQDTGYTDWSLSWFISVPPHECWDSISIWSRPLPSKYSTVRQPSFHPTVYWWSRWVCSCKLTKTRFGKYVYSSCWRDSSVGIVSRLRDKLKRNRCSNPMRGKRFCFFVVFWPSTQ
jgi:hypothetical protein